MQPSGKAQQSTNTVFSFAVQTVFVEYYSMLKYVWGCGGVISVSHSTERVEAVTATEQGTPGEGVGGNDAACAAFLTGSILLLYFYLFILLFIRIKK